jgi:hypothetical protein
VLKYYADHTIALTNNSLTDNNLQLNKSHRLAAIMLLLTVFLLVCMPLSVGYNNNTNTLAFASSAGGGDDGGGGDSGGSSSSSDSSSSKEDKGTAGDDGGGSGDGISNDEQTGSKKNDGDNNAPNDNNIPPPGPDNTGGDQNQDTKNNKPTCSQGQHYDETLKTCVNDKNEGTGLTDQQCAIGEHFDDKTNTCVKDTLVGDQQAQGITDATNNPAGEKVCTGETHFDTKLSTCIDNSLRDYGGDCAPGWHGISDPVYNDPILCEKDTPTKTTTPAVNCDPKYHKDSKTGECISNDKALPDGTCVQGYHPNPKPTSDCVEDIPPAKTTPVVNCDPGTHLDAKTGKCIPNCDSESHYDAAKGLCAPNSQPLDDKGTCITDYHYVNGQCLSNTVVLSDGTCAPGWRRYNINGPGSDECVSNDKPDYHGNCAPGYHLITSADAGKKCEKDTPPPPPTGGGGTTTGGNTATTTSSSSSSTTTNIINKNIIQGNQPIGSSAATSGIDITTTGKPFKEFNDRRNAATGLAVTNTTIAHNQFISGQVDVSGRVQNLIPVDLYQMSEAKNIIITATLYDSLNNTIGVIYGASNPNTLRSGDSGLFNLIVPNPSSNVDHAVYLVQWIDQNGVIHPSSSSLSPLPTQGQQQQLLPQQQQELQQPQ